MIELEKKDVHNSDIRLKRYFERIKKSSMSQRQKKKISTFVEDIRIGKVGKKVKNHRIISYLQFFLLLHKYFKKDIDKITEKEARQFYINLQDNKIKRKSGLPYAQGTKDLFIKTLKKYFNWIYQNKDHPKYKKVVGWMKEERKKSNKRAITYDQARDIIKEEPLIRNKCLFMFLFDSGCRIEEALNIRFLDLETHKKTNEKDEYYLVRVRVSKTKPRRIAIPLCTKELNIWLKNHPQKESKEDFLFPLNYDNARKIIRIMSKRVLDHSLSPHELRHSSVTHYVQKFGLKDISGFYYRYGWAFGSPEAKPYINDQLLGGEAQQEQIIKIIDNDRLQELEEEMKSLKKKYAKLLDTKVFKMLK